MNFCAWADYYPYVIGLGFRFQLLNRRLEMFRNQLLEKALLRSLWSVQKNFLDFYSNVDSLNGKYGGDRLPPYKRNKYILFFPSNYKICVKHLFNADADITVL